MGSEGKRAGGPRGWKNAPGGWLQVGEQGARTSVSPLGEQCRAPTTHPCLAPPGGPGSGSNKGGLCTCVAAAARVRAALPGPPNLQLGSPGVCLLQSSRLGSQRCPLDPRHGDELCLARISRPWHCQKLWGLSVLAAGPQS